ncbi:hypothetical protein GCM10010964_00880 [Caldovatus sediminis]|uniref:Uncharacterized protein n=1 Tax=Caldovatus sediminis TaxID=2041189 RepID=A0A8J2Z854_9PROT|nr:hypothetical protein [Caldovatus sediminis]GGG16405.1 hypothetical protein GCM10010964_00880 [Caldovatus sediminis]
MSRLAVALLALLFALPAARAARAQQDTVVSRHGAWVLVRDGRAANGPCFLSLTTEETPPALRMDWVPREDGSLFLIFAVRGLALAQPVAPRNRVAFAWRPDAADAPERSAVLTLAGFRVVQEEPRATVMHVAIGSPELVRGFLANAVGTVGLRLTLLRAIEVTFDTRGLPEAWMALKACNPAVGAALP